MASRTAFPAAMGERRGTVAGRGRYLDGEGRVPSWETRGTERGTAGTEAGKWGYRAAISPQVGKKGETLTGNPRYE